MSRWSTHLPAHLPARLPACLPGLACPPACIFETTHLSLSECAFLILFTALSQRKARRSSIAALGEAKHSLRRRPGPSNSMSSRLLVNKFRITSTAPPSDDELRNPSFDDDAGQAVLQGSGSGQAPVVVQTGRSLRKPG